jgi:hypothetical protein
VKAIIRLREIRNYYIYRKRKKEKSESNIEIKEKIDHVLIAKNLKIK